MTAHGDVGRNEKGEVDKYHIFVQQLSVSAAGNVTQHEAKIHVKSTARVLISP